MIWNQLDGQNSYGCRFIFKQSIVGIRLISFVFDRAGRSNSPVLESIGVDRKTHTVNIRYKIGRNPNNFFAVCKKLIGKHIGEYLKGNNTEGLAFKLLNRVYEMNDLIGKPKYVGDKLNYDFSVPVRSTRAEGVVNVHIEVKSSVEAQKIHIEKRPRTPSIVVTPENFDRLMHEVPQLLYSYVNEAKVMHLS